MESAGGLGDERGKADRIDALHCTALLCSVALFPWAALQPGENGGWGMRKVTAAKIKQ